MRGKDNREAVAQRAVHNLHDEIVGRVAVRLDHKLAIFALGFSQLRGQLLKGDFPVAVIDGRHRCRDDADDLGLAWRVQVEMRDGERDGETWLQDEAAAHCKKNDDKKEHVHERNGD